MLAGDMLRRRQRLAHLLCRRRVKAAFFDQHGGLDVLQVGAQPDPVAGPGDVVIDVKACALNHLDLFVRDGWPGLRLPLPHIGGTDMAGVVSAVGEGVDDFAVGDEVIINPGLNFEEDDDGHLIVPPEPQIIGETCGGGLAEKVLAPASRLVAKPPAWSWEEAAAFPLTALTVMRMLRKARAKPGQRVLVIGAGGGIGVMSIQLAKALGCEVFATTGGADKVAKVTELGVDHVIDYKADPDWWKTVYGQSGKQGMDVVIDCVGQATWKYSLRTLRPGGRLVTCGATTGAIAETNIQLVFWKQLELLGSTMGSPQDLARALELALAGKVRPILDSVFALDDVRDAQERMENGKQFGKIVLKP